MRGKIYLRSGGDPAVLEGDIAFGEPYVDVLTDDGRLLMVPLSAISFIEIERKRPQGPDPEDLKG